MTLKITIDINGDELYEIEAHYQRGPIDGICDYLIVANGEEVGRLSHHRPDGAHMLARHMLNSFPAPERTLQEQGGAHTAAPSTNVSLVLDMARDALVYGEAEASAKLAQERE